VIDAFYAETEILSEEGEENFPEEDFPYEDCDAKLF
jgi:hypothetical protein